MIAASAAIFVGIPALAVTTVGISRNSKGKKGVSRINNIQNTSLNDISFDIKPCAQYNHMTHNFQPGVALRIKF